MASKGSPDGLSYAEGRLRFERVDEGLRVTVGGESVVLGLEDLRRSTLYQVFEVLDYGWGAPRYDRCVYCGRAGWAKMWDHVDGDEMPWGCVVGGVICPDCNGRLIDELKRMEEQ